MNKYFIYILRCADGTLYTGITTDIKRRVREHNAGAGARYTRARRPLALIYSAPAGSHSDALKKEYAIKKMSRENKLKLVRGARRSARSGGRKRRAADRTGV